MRSRRFRFAPLLALATGPVAAPAQVVDSIRPVEVELARFRAAGAGPVRALQGGAPGREELARRFVRAVETRDTAALVAMHLTRDEFAWLYYPATVYTRPPYRQAPGLVWFRMTARSQRGLGRVLARDAGRPLGYRGLRCPADPVVQGANRVWPDCRLDLAGTGGTVTRRLFGSILERGGQFKFLTYDTEY
jgi:hypothetical protein